VNWFFIDTRNRPFTDTGPRNGHSSPSRTFISEPDSRNRTLVDYTDLVSLNGHWSSHLSDTV